MMNEIQYEESMLRLRKYYGDPQKVVNACLGEVRAFPGIEAFDYKALVEYKNCIINFSMPCHRIILNEMHNKVLRRR